MERKIHGVDYDYWRINIGGWDVPDRDLLLEHKIRRRPLPADIQEKRRAHMIDMKAKGYPVSWLARLYRMSRMQVTRIINNRPNN